jgi:MSHA biogenesis protein MshM
MYQAHFGLKEFPFSITPDTSFFFTSHESRAGLNVLLLAARTGEGFIKITGEVGTGKTLLCRMLMRHLGPNFQVAYLPNPYLEPITLYQELASELGVELPADGAVPSQHWLIQRLHERLIALAVAGRRAVVCLDEAQAMPIETLEALRLLTNLETEKRKLLQVIIFGQPELEERLNHPSIRQLKQRITFDYRLRGLSRDELDYYLHHRLTVAGHTGGRVFTPAAIRLLARRTGGSPRLVNILAHKSLLSAYGKGRRLVDTRDVRSACRDTASVPATGRRTAGVALLLLLLLASAAAALTWIPRP